eukprot:7600478-Pyramimonas_sp.AAC.1
MLCRISSQKLGLQGRACYDAVIRDLRSSKYSYFEKGCVRANACGACWAQEKAVPLGYQIPEVRCSLCGGPSDSMWHRLWVRLAVDDLREELCDPEVLQASSEVDLATVSNDQFV